jgi:hypothetical protein
LWADRRSSNPYYTVCCRFNVLTISFILNLKFWTLVNISATRSQPNLTIIIWIDQDIIKIYVHLAKWTHHLKQSHNRSRQTNSGTSELLYTHTHVFLQVVYNIVHEKRIWKKIYGLNWFVCYCISTQEKENTCMYMLCDQLHNHTKFMKPKIWEHKSQ